MIDIGEVAADVGLKDVGGLAGEVGEAFQGAVGAVADAVGVGVGDEAALEDGLNNIAKGVMNHSVAVGCGGDPAWFWVVDFKVEIVAGLVGLSLEFGLELEDFCFKIEIKS